MSKNVDVIPLVTKVMGITKVMGTHCANGGRAPPAAETLAENDATLLAMNKAHTPKKMLAMNKTIRKAEEQVIRTRRLFGADDAKKKAEALARKHAFLKK